MLLFSERVLTFTFVIIVVRPSVCLSSVCIVGRRLSAATGNARETAFLFQCISVSLQRFNAVLIHKSFVAPDVEPYL